MLLQRVTARYPQWMELTRSFERVVPGDVLTRYDFRETRNAAAVLAASNPVAFGEILDVLREFRLIATDIMEVVADT